MKIGNPVPVMVLLAATGTLTAPATAQTLPAWNSGRIKAVYADPSDIVLELDTIGPCAGNLFNIRRGSVNFTELTALMYTAAAMRTGVSLYITGCDDQRNIVSHGSAQLP